LYYTTTTATITTTTTITTTPIMGSGDGASVGSRDRIPAQVPYTSFKTNEGPQLLNLFRVLPASPELSSIAFRQL